MSCGWVAAAAAAPAAAYIFCLFVCFKARFAAQISKVKSGVRLSSLPVLNIETGPDLPHMPPVPPLMVITCKHSDKAYNE